MQDRNVLDTVAFKMANCAVVETYGANWFRKRDGPAMTDGWYEMNLGRRGYAVPGSVAAW